jgi:hypothetical protein
LDVYTGLIHVSSSGSIPQFAGLWDLPNTKFLGPTPQFLPMYQACEIYTLWASPIISHFESVLHTYTYRFFRENPIIFLSGKSNTYILPCQFCAFCMSIRPLKYMHSSRPVPYFLLLYQASRICILFRVIAMIFRLYQTTEIRAYFQANYTIFSCASSMTNTCIPPC